MPQHVIRKGKIYVEYSPNELSDIQQKQREDEAIKLGRTSPTASVFEQSHTTNPTRKTQKGNLG